MFLPLDSLNSQSTLGCRLIEDVFRAKNDNFLVLAADWRTVDFLGFGAVLYQKLTAGRAVLCHRECLLQAFLGNLHRSTSFLLGLLIGSLDGFNSLF